MRTDHRPLQWLRNLACPSTRLARWLLIVRQFEFRIEFVSGISNAAADALSRFFIYGKDEEEDETEPGIVLNNVRLNDSDQKQGDQDIEILKSWILSGSRPEKQAESNSNELNCYYRHFDKFKVVGGNVYRELKTKSRESVFQYVVPKEKREQVLELLHDSVWSGHLARDKTLDKFQERFYWPKSYTQVLEHVKACDICQRAKSSPENTQPLQPIRANEPFEIVTIDIIGPILPESKSGNKYILVMVCHCIKYVNLTAMKTQTAKEVAKHVFNLFCRHSCPKRILTDQGKCFEAELFQELLALLDIAKSRTTPYHPQADGLTKRLNRTLERMLRFFIEENLSDWDEYLDPLAFA